MHASRPRLGVVALALAGALVAIGLARWRSESSVPFDASSPPPPPPAVRPADSELRPAPPRPITRGRGASIDARATGATAAAAAEATVVRRIHVRLPDGTDAREGTVIWCDRESDASQPVMAYGVMASAPIGPGGIAKLLFEAVEDAYGSTLFVAVPGRPNVHVGYPGGLPDETTEVAIPEGVLFSGTVVDPAGRGIPDLPILVTSGRVDRSMVLDEDLDFARRAERRSPPDFVHIEASTDAAGRFTVKVRETGAEPHPKLHVLSRAPSWYVISGPSSGAPGPADGRDVGPIHAVRGVHLELDVSARDKSLVGEWLHVQVSQRSKAPDALESAGETDDRSLYLRWPVGHVRMARTAVEEDEVGIVAVALTGREQTHAAGVAYVTFPVDIFEARAALVLDRLDDVARTGLVEMVVPGANGKAGTPTGLNVDVTTADDPPLHVEVRRDPGWTGPDRLEVRLGVGRFRVALRATGALEAQPLEATVDVVAGVTTRVTMARRVPR